MRLLWEFSFSLLYGKWTCFANFVTQLLVLYTISFLHIDLSKSFVFTAQNDDIHILISYLM